MYVATHLELLCMALYCCMDTWDGTVVIATCCGPDSPWFEPQQKQGLLDPPRLAMSPM